MLLLCLATLQCESIFGRVYAIHDQLKEKIYVKILQARMNRRMIQFFFSPEFIAFNEIALFCNERKSNYWILVPLCRLDFNDHKVWNNNVKGTRLLSTDPVEDLSMRAVWWIRYKLHHAMFLFDIWTLSFVFYRFEQLAPLQIKLRWFQTNFG